jgi:uncharacterized protein YmfQ (DUF2313 family)
MARNVNDYILMLKSLLPIGRAWTADKDSNLYNLLYAQSEELSRIDDRFDKLMLEADTRYADELILNHETDFGLPDECTDSSSTLTERRNECHTKLLARGGLTKFYYEELAASYGYNIQIKEFTPLWCGIGTCGSPCGDQWVIFVWQVSIDYSSGVYVFFTSGTSVSGDPLIKVAGIDTLICLLNKYKPAHTIIKYVLDGYEFDSAFSNAFDSYPTTTTTDWLEGAFNKSFGIAFDVHYGGAFNWDAFSSSFDKPAG